MNQSDKDLWLHLQNKNLIDGDFSANAIDTTPWYIKTMQGFAGWIAALFMLAFVGTLFGTLFFNDNEMLLGIGGLGCCITSFLIFKNRGKNRGQANFFEQLALALSLCGQFMMAWALFEFFSMRETTVFLLLAVIQGALALLMPNFLHRVISSWFAMVALFWGLNQQGIFGLDSAIAAALFTLIWIKDTTGYKYQSILIPISFGFAISLVQFSGHFLFSNELAEFFMRENPSFLQHYGPTIGSAILALTCIYLVFCVLSEQKISLTSRSGVLSLSGITLLLAVSVPITGLSSAILILIVGFLRQRITLMALGVIALISFISWYYYNLAETLLIKSIYLFSLGSLFLLVLWGLRYVNKSPKAHSSSIQHQEKRNLRKWLTVGCVCLVLACININIYQKESVINEGRTVLLELAPVDPRSLMQGDYMRLRYQIGNQVHNEAAENEITDGYAVVELSDQQVATFIQIETDKLDGSDQLKPNQLFLQFRIRDRRLKFATNAFFFEEGSAEKYEKAKYGEFKVSDKGEMLLVGMRDKNHKLLGRNNP
ncbi:MULTISPECIES: GDYXXLXY domain-containing protein [unclassified Neptuniibacter]|uniref:GDYXXLXY domain-containing protein n=1 Tax=unclassified Neptuniibacter TaxID=2630693 RepID=UPI000C61DE75|nr:MULTISPECIES: GDYXXLXY domain-containing protein [unclassified Neptuniibacter]MAY41368.1 hypothetical protein [Oceanospirillaceae bacterium]|tara:strand:- start:5356 stop:6981 length:1626 start_codon:yes stop_codon:yes gene_type:complete